MRDGLLRHAKRAGAGASGNDSGHERPPRYVHDGGPTYVRKPVQSIGRHPRDRSAGGLPLSDAQREVLALLGDEPVGATVLATRSERSRSGLTASLYALADRGLVERVPYKGWKLV